MLITLLTPCRNAEKLLRATLESIWAQRPIACGRAKLEHIIIDGSSTDHTASVARAFPESRFLSEPDSGMYDALAKGLSRVDGDIVGYLNAGDVLFPWAFDVLLEVFLNPDVHWATGYSSQINEQGQVTACWKPPRYRREFVANGFYADPALGTISSGPSLQSIQTSTQSCLRLALSESMVGNSASAERNIMPRSKGASAPRPCGKNLLLGGKPSAIRSLEGLSGIIP